MKLLDWLFATKSKEPTAEYNSVANPMAVQQHHVPGRFVIEYEDEDGDNNEVGIHAGSSSAENNYMFESQLPEPDLNSKHNQSWAARFCEKISPKRS